jgi:hypothetical protein
MCRPAVSSHPSTSLNPASSESKSVRTPTMGARTYTGLMSGRVRTNPHNSPGLTTSLTPPPPVFKVLGDPGVLIVDNRLVWFTVGVPVGVKLVSFLVDIDVVVIVVV